ncbi:hypothetical protein [Burkholderia sp. 8Y]|nr:hypothetical protein [Burkholderia sp. 8Y]
MQSSNLRQGDSGDDEKTLQRALAEHGFSPGAINASLIPFLLDD